MKLRAIILVLGLLVGSALAQTRQNGFQSVAASIEDFQTKQGGFSYTKDAAATTAATSNALFLSALLGLKDKIDSDGAARFVTSLKNSDGGFSAASGQSSDIESTRHAILAFGHLGLPVGDKPALENFVKGLWDAESKLYAGRKGEKGSIRATAYALHTLEILGASGRDWAVKAAEEVRKGLKEATQDNVFVFPKEAGLDELSANYYGIMAGYFASFKFDNVEAWASYFSERQVREGRAAGGYITSKGARQVSIVGTARAVSALHYLAKAVEIPSLVDSHCDTRSLARFVQLIPHDLQAATYAFLAVSRTGLFEELFQKAATYEVLNGEVTETAVIQGTQLKPLVSVRTFFGVPHTGFTVEAVLTHKAVGTKNMKLAWNQESQQYQASEFFDSADKLGELNIVYTGRLNLGGESLTFTIRDSKKIGYYIKVKSTASLAGKDIEPNGVIGVGTVFSHAVSLATQNKAKVSSGDFDVVYSVVDSAGAVIHTEKKEGKNSKDSSFTFNFELKSSDFPAGAVTHRFEVKNADGAHTTHAVAYQLNTPMVASHITFKGVAAGAQPTFKIGETVVVSMQPGSLPDLRTVVSYDAADAAGAKAGELRQFFMDTFAGEKLVRSIRGKASENSEGKLVYTFEIPISATFDSIGKQRVAFRYQARTAGAKPVTLGNFDSAAGELLDDSQPLTFTVNAKLEAVDLVVPEKTALSYGDEATFSFKVVDTLSGKNVWVNAEASDATVALVLRADGAVADRKAAEQVADEDGKPKSFSVDWAVSANAKKGAATLELVVAAPGGDVALNTKDGKAFKLSVTVGGDIAVSHKVHQVSSLENFHNAFTVQFELTCGGKTLAGAQLRSVVKVAGASGLEEIAALPVSANAENGIYEVSYVGVDEVARAGKYQIELFREVDAGAASPLATVSFEFDAGSSEILPVRTETVALLALVGSFLFFSIKKLRLERQK